MVVDIKQHKSNLSVPLLYCVKKTKAIHHKALLWAAAKTPVFVVTKCPAAWWRIWCLAFCPFAVSLRSLAYLPSGFLLSGWFALWLIRPALWTIRPLVRSPPGWFSPHLERFAPLCNSCYFSLQKCIFAAKIPFWKEYRIKYRIEIKTKILRPVGPIGIRLYQKYADAFVGKLQLFFLSHNAAAMEPEMTDFCFLLQSLIMLNLLWR